MDKPIVYIHRSESDHCWVIVLGPALSHPVKIRNGLYSDKVEASIVASEVATFANGAVRVKVV
jgi:hypothetical protein